MNINVKLKSGRNKIHIKPIGLIIVLLLLVLVILAFWGGKNIYLSLKYSKYTRKMDMYGLTGLYNNGKATAYQKVSNEEMLKIVFAAVSGNLNIDEIKKENVLNILDKGYTNKITSNNLKDNATYDETVLCITRMLERYLELEIPQVELKMSNSKLEKYTETEKQDISKAVSLEIILNKNSALNDKEILKGKLNELIVTVIEQYATIYYKADGKVKLVTEQDKLPSNYKEYPYIVDRIETNIYEYDFKTKYASDFTNPKDVYQKLGYLYYQIDEKIVEYFDYILNIDYETITVDNFIDDINSLVLYRLENEDVEAYVDYVKKNQIKLKGAATPLLPIIYYNGKDYLVRTKITFEVLNSNTQDNLLFGDENSNIKYNGKQITMYVDLPLGMTLTSNSLRIRAESVAGNMCLSSTNVVVEK